MFFTMIFDYQHFKVTLKYKQQFLNVLNLIKNLFLKYTFIWWFYCILSSPLPSSSPFSTRPSATLAEEEEENIVTDNIQSLVRDLGKADSIREISQFIKRQALRKVSLLKDLGHRPRDSPCLTEAICDHEALMADLIHSATQCSGKRQFNNILNTIHVVAEQWDVCFTLFKNLLPQINPGEAPVLIKPPR